MGRIIFRPATAEAARALYGEPFKVTVSGFVLTVEGSEEPAGFVGYYPEGGRWILFVRFTERAREALQTISGLRAFMRAARGLLKKNATMPVVTHCDRAHARAAELLEHMGFKPLPDHKDTYQWAI